MKKLTILAILMLLGFFLIPARVGWAHGTPVISVQPLVASAGSTITVTGGDMEPGEVFAVSLVGMNGTISLGDATVTAEGEEGGFIAEFTIPENTSPGSYAVRAATDEGEKAETDLTVTAPSSQASAAPAVMQEASGAQHQLDHTKPLLEVVGVAGVALLSGVAGLWLVLRKSS